MQAGVEKKLSLIEEMSLQFYHSNYELQSDIAEAKVILSYVQGMEARLSERMNREASPKQKGVGFYGQSWLDPKWSPLALPE